MKKKISILTIAIALISLSTYAQNDAIWEKAVNNWETSKNLKADYVVKSIVAGAKGFSSDYNKEGGVMEGGIIYGDSGKFKIKAVSFTNKGELFVIDEPKASKDSYTDMMHTKEHLVLAKASQKHLTIKKVSDDDAEISVYDVKANIPDYPEFHITAYINSDGIPIKVVNSKFKKGKSSSAGNKMTIKYKVENDQLIVHERLEEVKVEFFGNASYITDSYIFSKYK